MNGNSRRVLYMIAGMYLVYSGGNLLMGVMRGGEGNHMVMLVAGVAFVLTGLFLIIDYVRYRKKMFLEQQAEQEDSIETIEAADSEKEED